MAMTEQEFDAMPMLMTDAEVARFLGRSKETVKRLRTSGELPYLPGRPPMIRKSDVVSYLDRNTVREQVPSREPAIDLPKTQAQIEADARAWALKVRMKPRRIRRGPANPAK